MSGWVSPTHPAPSPIPFGALRIGDGAGRFPSRVDGALWRRRSQGSHGKAADGRTAKFEATASPVRFACEIPLERI